MSDKGRIHFHNSTPDSSIADTDASPVDLDVTDRALHQRIAASDVTDPATWYVTVDSALGAGDNSVLYASGDISMYNVHYFENNTLVSADVQVNLDGAYGGTSIAALEILGTLTAGQPRFAVVADNEIAVLRGKFKNLKVLMTGAGTPAAGLMTITHAVE